MTGALARRLALLLALAGSGGPVGAQEGPFTFQIRGGATMPLADFRAADEGWEGETAPGTSLAMGFTFPLMGPVGAYLGFGQHRFACDQRVCPSGAEWISTGFDVAARWVVGRRRLRPWVQAGFHNHRLEGRILEEGEGRALTSDGGGGFEVGGGLLIQVGERTSLAPGLRYGEGNVPFTVQGRMRPRYLVADVGLSVGF